MTDGTSEVNLEKVLNYSITQESFLMLNVDGTMHKAVKCPLLGFFKLDILDIKCISFIVNMGLICKRSGDYKGMATTTRERLKRT